MKRKVWLWLGAAALVLGGAGALALTRVEARSKAATEALYTRGLNVYGEQHCGACHTLSAAGTGGTFGPSNDARATVARTRYRAPDYHGSARSAEAYIRESIVTPNAYVVPGYALSRFHMPAFTGSEDDLDALVALLSRQD